MLPVGFLAFPFYWAGNTFGSGLRDAAHIPGGDRVVSGLGIAYSGRSVGPP